MKQSKNKERERAYKIKSKKLLTPSGNGCRIKTIKKGTSKNKARAGRKMVLVNRRRALSVSEITNQ